MNEENDDNDYFIQATERTTVGIACGTGPCII